MPLTLLAINYLAHKSGDAPIISNFRPGKRRERSFPVPTPVSQGVSTSIPLLQYPSYNHYLAGPEPGAVVLGRVNILALDKFDLAVHRLQHFRRQRQSDDRRENCSAQNSHLRCTPCRPPFLEPPAKQPFRRVPAKFPPIRTTRPKQNGRTGNARRQLRSERRSLDAGQDIRADGCRAGSPAGCRYRARPR